MKARLEKFVRLINRGEGKELKEMNLNGQLEDIFVKIGQKMWMSSPKQW